MPGRWASPGSVFSRNPNCNYSEGLGVQRSVFRASVLFAVFALPVVSWAQASQSADASQDQTLSQPASAQAAPSSQTGPSQPTPAQPGQLPDTVSAPPFTIGDKFDYRIVQTFGARGFVGAAIGASIGQADGAPKEWGQGAGAFARRYVSGFAGNVTRQTLSFTIESALHEDPRYFPSEEKSFKSRSLNAIKQIIYCKKDNGDDSFAYGRVVSAFANGQLVNAWQPASTGTVADGFKRGIYTMGADAAYNFMQEFLPFTRPISLRHRH